MVEIAMEELPMIQDITDIHDLIQVTNCELGDALYISDNIEDEKFIPEKKNINREYFSDFTLKSRRESRKLIKNKQARMAFKYKEADFFVYNQKTRQLFPFKKNDYLIYDHGYLTFDGKDYISYEDNDSDIGGGKEIGRWSYKDYMK